MKYTCPCCGYRILDEEPTNTYQICSICYWEDDGLQFNNPFYEGGANHISLKEAQENFIKFGYSKEHCKEYVRKSTPEDIFEGPKDISEILKVSLIDMIKIFHLLHIDTARVLELVANNKVEKNTNFRFDSKELEAFLTYEQILTYKIKSS